MSPHDHGQPSFFRPSSTTIASFRSRDRSSTHGAPRERHAVASSPPNDPEKRFSSRSTPRRNETNHHDNFEYSGRSTHFSSTECSRRQYHPPFDFVPLCDRSNSKNPCRPRSRCRCGSRILSRPNAIRQQLSLSSSSASGGPSRSEGLDIKVVDGKVVLVGRQQFMDGFEKSTMVELLGFSIPYLPSSCTMPHSLLITHFFLSILIVLSFLSHITRSHTQLYPLIVLTLSLSPKLASYACTYSKSSLGSLCFPISNKITTFIRRRC